MRGKYESVLGYLPEKSFGKFSLSEVSRMYNYDQFVTEAYERLGYYPGHDENCPEGQVPYEFSHCSCGPKPEPSNNEVVGA
jgi:hypothetical protein